ncbi:MAG: 1-acyl-sn-glycerol-3-phosphate acyltransferase [Clostridiales bacterium]|nr:1-acyl-sn-glycerol-3-phosphate acyltransferase [Clostridiales bacterium]
MKEFDYSKTGDRKFYKAFMPVGKALSHILYKIEYYGEENIPTDRGYIVACNHITALDPVHCGGKIKGQIHFMGKQELFKSPVSAWFLTHMNTFPVRRGASDIKALEYAIKVVSEGGILGIFPEGTRSEDFKPAQPKSGVALVARVTHADILPVSLYTDENAKFRSKLTVRYGAPIKYEELGFTEEEEHSQKKLRAAAQVVMERICDLWSKGHEK